MIDFNNEVFTTVANAVRGNHITATVTGEYIRRPAKFPAVVLDEIANTMVDRLEDSSNEERYAGVTYRLQVFSNKQNGKKTEAREIFATADAEMRRMGFRRVSYAVTPEIYDSSIYEINAIYEGVIDTFGNVYKL